VYLRLLKSTVLAIHVRLTVKLLKSPDLPSVPGASILPPWPDIGPAMNWVVALGFRSCLVLSSIIL